MMQQCCDEQAPGGTRLCKAHKGGQRCSQEGCDRSARNGTELCTAHGGGKRCKEEGCNKHARGGYKLCKRHMPRCQAAVSADEPGVEPISCVWVGWLRYL
jgi:hypothetical protein